MPVPRGSILLVLSFSLIGGALAQDKPRLEWCLDHFPPRHYYIEGQPPYGAMVEMMEELALRGGFELTYSMPTPFERCLSLLQEGKTDLMTGLLDSPQRQTYLYLIPFDEARSEHWFGHVKALSVSSAEANRVALVRRRLYSAGIQPALLQSGYQIDWYEDDDQALMALYHRKVEYLIGPLHLLQRTIDNLPRYRGVLIPIQPPLPDVSQTAHLGLAKKSPHANLHAKIRDIMALMVEEGKTHFYAVDR